MTRVQWFVRRAMRRDRREAYALREATVGAKRFTGLEPLEPRQMLDATVTFNELMYNHPSNDAELEWVELHSQMAVNMDLSGWRLSGGIDYEFPPGTVMPAGGYLVIAKSPTALEAATGHAGALGPFNGRLDNAGELIRLRDINDRTMDELDYRDGGDWPVAPDGGGVTLAKRSGNGATAEVSSWTFSTQVGGTPGAVNFTTGPLTGPTVTLIEFDDIWRFDDRGMDLGTAWREVGYDVDDPNGDMNNDDAWGAGPGLLGTETATLPQPIQTPASTSANTVYFRTTFEFIGNAAATDLVIDPIVDDGAVFYLNGHEVARLNMPAGAIDYNTTATMSVRNATSAGPISISNEHLVVGTNVLAVEVHQAAGGTGAGEGDSGTGSDAGGGIGGVHHKHDEPAACAGRPGGRHGRRPRTAESRYGQGGVRSR